MAAALPFIALAATAVGTGVSVYGAMQSAQAQQAADNAKAQQDQANAQLAANASNDAIARGNVAANAKAQQTAQLLGQQRAGLAANGVDANSGSALNLQSDVAGNGELDQLTIKSNAAREAAGYTAQGANYNAQGIQDVNAGANAVTAGMIGAGSSLLGGTAKVADSWYDINQGTRKQTPSV